MSIDYKSPEGILRLARARASFVWPYLSHAIFNLIPIKTNFPETFGMPPTFAVDAHWRMYWDPEAVAKWGLELCTTAIRHEVEHLLRIHHDRAKSAGISEADHAAWLCATDIELNDGLLREVTENRNERKNHKEGHLVDFGGDWLLPKKFGLPDDQIAEQYLEHLRKMVSKSNCPGSDCGSGAHGVPRPWELPSPHSQKNTPGLSKAEADYIRTKVAEAIRGESQKTRGTVPSDWVRWANEVLQPPKVDWRNELRSVVRCAVHEVAGMHDYSYTRPSRRQDSYGDVIAPSMRKPIPRVAVFGDTSGSMSDKDIANIPAEVEGICQALGASVLFISVDADVHGKQEVIGGKNIILKGGGGTDMRLGFAAALESRPRPDIIVGITDCETPWPDEAPNRCRTIIVRVGGRAAAAPAWARVVDVD